MPPKYDTQILVGIGVLALIAMGISESNKKKVSEGDEPMQDPPAVPQPVQPSDMDVAKQEAQAIVEKCHKVIKPSCKTMTGKMDLKTARQTRGTRIAQIEAWAARAKYWMDNWGERFAYAGLEDIVRMIHDCLRELDAWFDDMARPGKGQERPLQANYHLHQTANVNNQFVQGMDMMERTDDARAQQMLRTDDDGYPSKTKPQGDWAAWDNAAVQRQSGHLTGMDINDPEPTAPVDILETNRAAQVFDYASQAKNVEIDFSGNSDQTQQAGVFVGSPAASIYGGKPADDYHDEGMPSAKTTFNVDNDPQPGSANDTPVFIQAPPTVSAKPPQVIDIRKPDREHVAPLKVRDAGALLDNLGAHEAILELNDPSGLRPDIDGTGEVQVFEKTPTPTPVTDMVEHQYNQFDARGNFVAAVTRKRIESELTGGIRDISKPVFDWEQGLH